MGLYLLYQVSARPSTVPRYYPSCFGTFTSCTGQTHRKPRVNEVQHFLLITFFLNLIIGQDLRPPWWSSNYFIFGNVEQAIKWVAQKLVLKQKIDLIKEAPYFVWHHSYRVGNTAMTCCDFFKNFIHLNKTKRIIVCKWHVCIRRVHQLFCHLYTETKKWEINGLQFNIIFSCYYQQFNRLLFTRVWTSIMVFLYHNTPAEVPIHEAAAILVQSSDA